jgi:hypothetical protein
MAVRILQKFAHGFAVSCGFFLALIGLFAATVASMDAQSLLVRYVRRNLYAV